MTSSKSFNVDALLLSKHRHQHQQHYQQLQQQPRVRRNDDMMLQLPLLHQSVSHIAAFSLYPFNIAAGGSHSAAFQRGTDAGTVRLPPTLPCLAAGLPTCLCPFCLPQSAAADTPAATSVHEQQRTSTESARAVTHALGASSPVTPRRGWQPWLQDTSAAELQSTPTNVEIADRLQGHRLTVTGRPC